MVRWPFVKSGSNGALRAYRDVTWRSRNALDHERSVGDDGRPHEEDSFTSGTEFQSATSAPMPPVLGGTTDVGVLTLRDIDGLTRTG